ncbi:MAG: hypothetical protein ACREAA_11190 [Candidatus Polarisedimenticolia bacterium]
MRRVGGAALCVLFLLIGRQTAAQAAVCYVRGDGSDTLCDGSADASSSAAPRCAFATVGRGAGACASPGSNLRIHGAAGGSWYVEQVSFTNSGTAAQPIVIEGYGPTKPHIGLAASYVNSQAWTYVPSDRTWYVPYTVGEPSAAYVLTERPYEHLRVGLVMYSAYADLTATADGLWQPSGHYYIGPGIFHDESQSRLYVRLDPTPQVTAYEQTWLPLGFTADSDPRNHRLLISYPKSAPDHSIRTAASHLTFRNLVIEAAHRTVQIGCPAEGGPAAFLVFEDNTIWSGNDGAVIGTCASEDVTLARNLIQADKPRWVSWGDCKNDKDGPCYDEWRYTLIQPSASSSQIARRWTLDHNYISGGHDGYGTAGGEGDSVIRYNVFEGIADDPFELEGAGVRRHDIYGNLILNSLICLAVGQDTTDSSYGPFFFHSNTCVLLGEPYVNRCPSPGAGCTCTTCQGGDWNGGRERGHEYAFKLEKPEGASSAGLHVYNNTVVLADSHPDKGMGVLGEDSGDAMVGAEIFNNIFIKMNQRVGQGGGSWDYHADPQVVDWNLYWKIHDNGGALLDDDEKVGNLCAELGQECHGLGNTDFVGTDPLLSTEGFGCFADANGCEGVDRADPTLWRVKAGSQYWSPATFIPQETSPVCQGGRGTVPIDFPANAAIPGIPFDPGDIGAAPCGVSPDSWNVFPFDQLWKSSSIASGVAPNAVMQQPGADTTVCTGQAVFLCGSKTDPDGAPPFTYLWDFEGSAECPPDQLAACPGSVVFPTPAVTCRVTFHVMDRWGLTDPTPTTRTVTVKNCGAAGGGIGGRSGRSPAEAAADLLVVLRAP